MSRNKKNHNHENIDKYKKYSNLFNKIKRSATVKYFEEKLSEYKDNIKETWKILNKAMCRNKSKPKCPDKMSINEETISSEIGIAATFNDYFVNIGNNITSSIPKRTFDFTKVLQKCQNTIFFDPVDTHQIETIINKMKSKPSCGVDNISTTIIETNIAI